MSFFPNPGWEEGEDGLNLFMAPAALSSEATVRARPPHPCCHHRNRGREEGRLPISSALNDSASPHGVSKPSVSPLPLGLRVSLPCPSSPPTRVGEWCLLDGLMEVVVEAVRGKVWCGP